jgi:hypothetical protein
MSKLNQMCAEAFHKDGILSQSRAGIPLSGITVHLKLHSADPKISPVIKSAAKLFGRSARAYRDLEGEASEGVPKHGETRKEEVPSNGAPKCHRQIRQGM